MSGVVQITTVEQAIEVLQRAAGHLSAGRLRPAEEETHSAPINGR